ncbi:hypothetical protein BD310DRAFT_541862 [Dichomitus squalens]|uniref:Uncharacterized protein n=1 Tax=Dichomitus squalens TaxID=114155 RepID=A0A4Q9PT11_9APHY|nr:hypothetical protein BD310DRAFT_541862 [Dichomitus squalens]
MYDRWTWEGGRSILAKLRGGVVPNGSDSNLYWRRLLIVASCSALRQHDHFLLNVDLALQLRLPVNARLGTPPLLRRRGVLILQPPHNAHPPKNRTLGARLQHDIVVCHGVVEHQAHGDTLVHGRLYDMVDRRLIVGPRGELHPCPPPRYNPASRSGPLAVASLRLETVLQRSPR